MNHQDRHSTHEVWLAESHRVAQASAMIWAQRAEEAHEKQLRYEDRADSWTPNAAHAEVIANERKEAQIHAVRATEARHMAEMWAQVTAVLVPPLEPVESMLEVRGD